MKDMDRRNGIWLSYPKESNVVGWHQCPLIRSASETRNTRYREVHDGTQKLCRWFGSGGITRRVFHDGEAGINPFRFAKLGEDCD